MPLEEKNRVKDLAREWGVSIRTIQRWLVVHRVTVLRPSQRTIIIEKREAERLRKKVLTRRDLENV